MRRPVDIATPSQMRRATCCGLLAIALIACLGRAEPRSSSGPGPKLSPVQASDRDGDGVPDDRDCCPDDPEDYDGHEDEDGCPEMDRDCDCVVADDGVCDCRPDSNEEKCRQFLRSAPHLRAE
jgi:hypothetical protein